MHREKIWRLKDSLRAPGTLPILGRDDLERISRYFRLDADERLRLSAAILATRIQRMVYERMHVTEDVQQQLQAAQFALRAAELLMPTLEEALRAVGEEEGQAFRQGESLIVVLAEPDDLLGGLMHMTTSGGEDASQLNEQQVDAALAGALDALDRGTLALSLSYAVPGSAERLERARAARDAFSDALERLDDQEAWVRASEPWRLWHAEARRGYDEADERVIDLGG